MIVRWCIKAVDLYGLKFGDVYLRTGSVQNINKLKELINVGMSQLHPG